MKKAIILLLLILFNINVNAQVTLTHRDVTIDEPIVLTENRWTTLTIRYKIPQGYYITENNPFIMLEALPSGTLIMGKTTITSRALEGKYSDEIIFTQRIKAIKNSNISPITLVARYQLCTIDGACYLPQSLTLPYPVGLNATTASTTLWFYLLLAFVGGIILNIMPCILPVLSLKFLMISNLEPASQKRFALSYSLGIVATFVFLALVLISLKILGHSFGWGFHWQQYAFIIFMLMLVFIMALNLLDFFPFVVSANSPQSAFGHGVVMVLLSTPCSAPFLGVAAGWALSQPNATILLFFIAVALGLSAPLYIFMLIPKSQHFFKLLGRLSTPIKWIGAISLLLVARWLFSLIISRANLTLLLVSLILLIAAIMLWNHFAKTKYQKISLVVMMALLVASYSIALKAEQPAPSVTINAPWHAYSEALVADALADNRPIFINIGAYWCITCRFNEATVLSNSDLLNYFEHNNVLLLKADLTYGVNADQQRLLSLAGRQSLPTYVVYDHNGIKHVLGELLTASAIKKLLP